MSWNPLVSILTPSFNQARWLGDNLGSVAAQTYERTEHIVIDGGSTDASLDILRRQAGPSVRWRSEPDRGQSDAINKAFADARGEVIGWLNSDDAYFSRDTVALVVDAFRRHPDADVAYGHAALTNADGLVLQVLWTPPMWPRVLRIHGFITQPTAFIRRRALDSHLVDSEFESMMDTELWLRLAGRHRFVRLDRILAIDRHQTARKTVTQPELAARDLLRLRQTRAVPSGAWVPVARKLLKVGFRIAGLTHVPEALHTELAYAGRVDGLGPLVLRQIAAPRSRMPLASERSQSNGSSLDAA
jgi:glycosyltransferase involved in cell wall biosynthesis